MTNQSLPGSIPARLVSEAFRVFFLAAALYGVFTGLIWVLWLASPLVGQSLDLALLAMAPPLWHAHEMIFGYGTAALAGFFLTAVPNWTNGQAARQGFISVVAVLWIAARLAVWFSGLLPLTFVALIDLCFLPVLAANLLRQLLKRPKPQNMLLLSALVAIWTGNLLVHLDWIGWVPGAADAGLRVGLTALCGLIAILGGRITPAFTRNAMKRAGMPEASWPKGHPIADKAVIALALLLPWSVVVLGTEAVIPGALALALGVSQGARMVGWRTRWTFGQPILLSLHAGLALLAFGMVLWGLGVFGIGNELAGLHVLGIGCVGTMTMAVMSRAALGHTGRALVAPGPVVIAYGLLPAAAALRWLSTDLPFGWYMACVLLAGALWTLAFALFAVTFWPILSNPPVSRDSQL